MAAPAAAAPSPLESYNLIDLQTPCARRR